MAVTRTTVPHPDAVAASVADSSSRASPGTTQPLRTPHPPRARPLVAVVDSGLARTPELAGSLVGEYDFAASPARPAYAPRYPHGTMVATILKRAADRPIDIVSMRIDDPAGCPTGHAPPCQPDGAPIANAVRKATQLGATAINLSLTLKNDPLIVDAIRDAAAQGVEVVMAAGNEGNEPPENRAAARAGFPHAIIVGALDANGRPWSGSNRPATPPRDYLFQWQRGVSVPTVLPDGEDVFATGTSMATPIETARQLDRPDGGKNPPNERPLPRVKPAAASGPLA